MSLLFAVAAGGAVGAVGRYLVMARVAHWLGDRFPYATLSVNVLGSLALGLLVGLSGQLWSLSPELLAFLTIGVLGAFTTFSTFALDVSLQVERKQRASAAIYVIASVALSIFGYFAGLAMVMP